MFDLKVGLHYHKTTNNTIPPIESIIGNSHGWTKEVNGNVIIKAVENRTSLKLIGAGAMKIYGNLMIGT